MATSAAIFDHLLDGAKQFDTLHLQLINKLEGKTALEPASVLQKLQKQAVTLQVWYTEDVYLAF